MSSDTFSVSAPTTPVYPYLVVRVMPSVYSHDPLPTGQTREQSIAAGWAEMDRRKRAFRICVVFGPEDAVYLEPDGSESQRTVIPSGGLILKPNR